MAKEFTADIKNNPFHKIMIEAGFTMVKADITPNRLAPNDRKHDHLEFVYQHPTRAKDRVKIWIYRDFTKSWHMYAEQKNGIIAPCMGDTKPQLIKALSAHYVKGGYAYWE